MRPEFKLKRLYAALLYRRAIDCFFFELPLVNGFQRGLIENTGGFNFNSPGVCHRAGSSKGKSNFNPAFNTPMSGKISAFRVIQRYCSSKPLFSLTGLASVLVVLSTLT
jgi:hypothetical protein